MRLSLLSFIVLIACSHAVAQKGHIAGKIIDQETREAIIGASILVKNTTLGSIADLEGNYLIKDVPAGAQTLVIKYVGYQDFTLDVQIVDGQTITAPQIELTSTSIGLTEVEVFANVVDDRKTPVAAATITALQIDEQLGGMAMPEILNSTPGVYATQGDGSYGDAYINIRGFGQEEVLFMFNGVPMNDMENGIMYWSNLAGLSEVTRSMQVQRGLGASKLGVNSVGGTINIITNSAEKRKGGSFEATMAGNSAYRNRYRLSLHSGLLKGDWSFSFQGSRTTGDGIRPGTYVDSYAYFLTASKKLNDNHNFMFTIFAAPTDRGRAWNTNTATYRQFDNYQYNEAFGYYNGEKFNVSQNKVHKPLMTLMHVWNPNHRFNVTTSVYASVARVYGTSIQRSQGTPAMGLTTDGLQNLEGMRAENLANVQTINNPYGEPFGSSITGAQSMYMLEGRYNNHNWYGVISNVNYELNSTTSLVAGIDARDYTATHYAKVHDLLGGEYWVDRDRFTGEDNNILMPNRIARKGDVVRYDYDGNVRWASVFAQLEKTINNIDIFASANLSRTQMWRNGNMWSGVQDPDFSNVYIYNSLGESDKRVFNNYNVKAGVNYRVTGRHNVFVNGGKFTRAPFLQNAFEQPEYANDFLLNLKNEEIQALEFGYSYRTGKLKARLNAYYTEWKNKGFVNTGNNDFANPLTGERQAITGIAAIHQGIELDITYDPFVGLELTAMISKGDWKWTNNGTAVFTDEGGAVLKSVQVYTDGLRVGNSAQTTAFIGAHYKGIDNMYFGARANYFADLYEMFDPAERVTGFKPVRELPDYMLLDIYGGYYFNIGELRSRAGFNIHNVLNSNVIRRSDERFDRQEFYSFPINYNASLTLYF